MTGAGRRVSTFAVLEVLADLMRGGAHSPASVSSNWRVSRATAERWLREMHDRIPGVYYLNSDDGDWYQYSARVGRAAKEP